MDKGQDSSATSFYHNGDFKKGALPLWQRPFLNFKPKRFSVR